MSFLFFSPFVHAWRSLSDSGTTLSFQAGLLERTSRSLSPFSALHSVDLVDLICFDLRAQSDKNTLSVLEVLPRSLRWGCLKMNLMWVSLSSRRCAESDILG